MAYLAEQSAQNQHSKVKLTEFLRFIASEGQNDTAWKAQVCRSGYFFFVFFLLFLSLV